MSGWAHRAGIVCPACGGDYGVVDAELGEYRCFCGARALLAAGPAPDARVAVPAADVPVEARVRDLGPGPSPAPPQRRRRLGRRR